MEDVPHLSDCITSDTITVVLEDIDIVISNIKLNFDELYATLQDESE